MTSARFVSDGTEELVLQGSGPRPEVVWLDGPRTRVDAVVTGGGNTWKARLPLAASRWGGPELPLPSGSYTLRLRTTPDDADEVLFTDSLPLTILEGLRATLEGEQGTLVIGPPVDPAYDSGAGQDALARRYVGRTAPLENAVFFESFYGRSASCNPLAIDRELARVAPAVTRYWSVVDLSIAVPEGAIAVVEGSPEWWRARGTARLLVVNDWLRRAYSRRPGQHVLQTWHGTPLKRLALHRPGFDPRRAVAVVRESRRWNVLLAANPYSESILRKAYAFLTRPVWVEGYPRNDVLTTGDGAAVRAQLGIAEGERVLLYAPTWRDDRDLIVDFFDPAELARRSGAVVLVRGHSRTLPAGRDAAGARVIDVTRYPDVSRLLLAADALITDYSSMMFDFAVTAKPMYFFVPDLEHYRGELRGFYFDLEAHAPGPVVRTFDDLVEAIEDPATQATYAPRYDAWRRKFSAREDGRAAERVLARILDQGFVDRD
ncbi:MAG: CDP-glycerol glycerophosphotransferase family protein [Microbacterium sp.]|uniref:CDP-glycerol glycerophosphotransferase family protein n=1 Tax=Microbacterium sp. TaxID=51671 RepID=UPI002717A2CE|nr:CDP-glycerol glycerophosphotransferase family protein [Microbacterium sp.]MDO8383663.1 CDP-glycerol glycerophosphotransferase family protein [Microbacterium sp.]